MTTTRPRVLMVCGSLQARSTNRFALAHAVATLDADVAWGDVIRDLPPFDPDLAEVAEPAVDEWRAVVAAAEVVLFAVPEYAGGMAGAVKNATDWLVGTGELYRKPVAVLSAGTSGGAHARRQTTQTLTWQGAWVVAELGIAAPLTRFDADGRVTDGATAAAIAAWAATALEPGDLVARATAVVGRLGIDTAHVAPA